MSAPAPPPSRREPPLAPLVLAMAAAFLLMCGYSLVKPLRDEVAAAHHQAISTLWTGTFLVTLVAMPLFGLLASRCSRRRLLTLLYRSFILCFLAFAWLFSRQEGRSFLLDGAFYIWVSVYNLFTLSLFWSLLADRFHAAAGKALFARITMGATLGAVVGPFLTATLVAWLGPAMLLLLSAGLLELGLRLLRRVTEGTDASQGRMALPDTRLGGSAWDGFLLILRSPQLRGICLFLLLMLVSNGFLYRLKAELASTITDRAARTAFYARIELVANLLTLSLQAFASGWLMKRRGITFTLMVLPLLAVACFGILGLWLSLTTVAVVDVLRRAGQYAMAKPAREVLFTVLPREEKYKAKSFIDTFVYRGGDVLVSYGYDLLASLGLGAHGLALMVIPSSLLWAGTARHLGHRHQQQEQAHSS